MRQVDSNNTQREEQVKVVIRLKPSDLQTNFSKCVYLSEKENELVVQTQNKKQLFVFDHIANQNSSQIDIYRMLGEQVVQRSFDGYNCCIFAYGQTGAGKSYSVMGNIADMHLNPYSQYRGLLPRIIEDVFTWSSSHQSNKCSITCSYLQVYNEQIFDLLSPDKRIHQIRQDFKRGVFVEGLIEKKLTSYRQGIQTLLQGEKTRRMASTSMNTESSRSHAIFSIFIQSEITDGETIKIRKSKLNIVDLAGSERVKHTNVMGEQLKQGCNINKSLHVLGNVINSLVQSAKKKKHIPFRDSKLTHYLKDSLGGNSITRLLANIHISKHYLGDTLSTLMFAKRAKILKLKVQLNENISQNFDTLRKQVRRLRQQLAQARYFKNETQRTDNQSFQQESQSIFQRGTMDNIVQSAPKPQIIQIFQQNQIQYKALIEVYQQHLATCGIKNQTNKFRKSLNMVGEWKNLEKKNMALINLVKRFPAFTKIYKQNIILHEQINNISSKRQQPQKLNSTSQSSQLFSQISQQKMPKKSEIEAIINYYEIMIDQMKQKFMKCIQKLQKNYSLLQQECKLKDKRLKDFMRQQNFSPDIEQLKNQNQYLHLNILNLENQISKLQQNDQKMKKDMKKLTNKNMINDGQFYSDDEQQLQNRFFIQKLQEIKRQAFREMEKIEIQREETDVIIGDLQKRINTLMIQNSQLQMKRSRNPSHKKNAREMLSRVSSSDNFKAFRITSFDSQELQMSQVYKKSDQEWERQISNIQNNCKRQMDLARIEIQQKQKTISQLKQQMKSGKQIDKIQQQFGKSLNQILQDYRENRKRLNNTKSMMNIHEFKEQDPLQLKIQPKGQIRNMKKLNLPDHNKIREIKSKKQQPLSTRNSMLHTKKPVLVTK